MIPYIIITVSTICILVFLLSQKNSFSIPLTAVAFFTGIAGIFIAKHSLMADTELWGGVVTTKDYSTSICNHTRTVCSGSGKSKTCTTVRDHTRDYYFWIKTDQAGDWTAECGDCSPPSWWENTTIGDHVAIPHSYQNYLLADENSLARPPKPVGVSGHNIPRKSLVRTHNEIHGDPVISDGVDYSEELVTAVKAWNSINGAKKQAYITLVLTTNSNPEYANLLAHTWYLGPKNGLTFVMSLNEGIIQWARLVSFSEDTSLHRWTADELTGYPLESAWELISEAVLQEHTRTPMKNYEYLKKNIRLSIPALFLIILFQVFGTAIAYVIILKLSGDSYARYNRWY